MAGHYIAFRIGHPVFRIFPSAMADIVMAKGRTWADMPPLNYTSLIETRPILKRILILKPIQFWNLYQLLKPIQLQNPSNFETHPILKLIQFWNPFI